MHAHCRVQLMENEGRRPGSSHVSMPRCYVGYAIHNLYAHIKCVSHTRCDVAQHGSHVKFVQAVLPRPPHLIIRAMCAGIGNKSHECITISWDRGWAPSIDC